MIFKQPSSAFKCMKTTSLCFTIHQRTLTFRPSFEKVNLWSENLMFHIEHGMALPQELQGDAVQFYKDVKANAISKTASKESANDTSPKSNEESSVERKGSRKGVRKKSSLSIINENSKSNSRMERSKKNMENSHNTEEFSSDQARVNNLNVLENEHRTLVYPNNEKDSTESCHSVVVGFTQSSEGSNIAAESNSACFAEECEDKNISKDSNIIIDENFEPCDKIKAFAQESSSEKINDNFCFY